MQNVTFSLEPQMRLQPTAMRGLMFKSQCSYSQGRAACFLYGRVLSPANIAAELNSKNLTKKKRFLQNLAIVVYCVCANKTTVQPILS